MKITVKGDSKELRSFCFNCLKSTHQKLYIRDGFLVLECKKCREELYMELD